jgi:hypothetical protein
MGMAGHPTRSRHPRPTGGLVRVDRGLVAPRIHQQVAVVGQPEFRLAGLFPSKTKAKTMQMAMSNEKSQGLISVRDLWLKAQGYA